MNDEEISYWERSKIPPKYSTKTGTDKKNMLRSFMSFMATRTNKVILESKIIEIIQDYFGKLLPDVNITKYLYTQNDDLYEFYKQQFSIVRQNIFNQIKQEVENIFNSATKIWGVNFSKFLDERYPEIILTSQEKQKLFDIYKNAYDNILVEDKILDGKFGTDGYNTKKLRSLLQLFKLSDFAKYQNLTVEDQERLYEIYKNKYYELHKDEAERKQKIINKANEKVFDEFLNDVEAKRVLKKDVLSFINSDYPVAAQFIDEIYRHYNTQIEKRKKKTNRPPPPPTQNKEILKYPFQTEKKQIEFHKNNKDIPIVNKIPDRKAKPLKMIYSRPEFAPDPYSWEIDHLVFSQDSTRYLFIININTRYLYVMKVPDKSGLATISAIRKFINMEQDNFNHPVKNIKGDGDKGFGMLKQEFPDINCYFQNSAFTYHNKIIDSVMKTLRDALGPNTNNYWNGYHDDTIQQLTNYYNNTWHRIIKMTPLEMHTDIDLEWKYIRCKMEELNDVKKRQIDAGYHNYKPGDKLMVHLELGKTDKGFEKRRRTFDKVATFIRYQNGNCYVKLKEPISGKFNIEIPIYYTERIYGVYQDTFNL